MIIIDDETKYDLKTARVAAQPFIYSAAYIVNTLLVSSSLQPHQDQLVMHLVHSAVIVSVRLKYLQTFFCLGDFLKTAHVAAQPFIYSVAYIVNTLLVSSSLQPHQDQLVMHLVHSAVIISVRLKYLETFFCLGDFYL